MARILAIIEQEEAFSKHAIFYQGRSEKFRHGLRKVGLLPRTSALPVDRRTQELTLSLSHRQEKRFVALANEHGWTREDQEMAEFLIDMPAAFGLHKSMWTTTVRNQGTEEQHKMFLEPSLKYEIIG